MKSILFILCLLFITNITFAQEKNDSLYIQDKAKEVLQKAEVKYQDSYINLFIRNVDITEFPVIKVILEAFNRRYEPLDTLIAENLTVLENDVEQKVISIYKLSLNERVPVDFIFIVDKTGSMQSYINGVKRNIRKFTDSLVKRGIDYQLGLITFSDYLGAIYKPTNDVSEFTSWLSEFSAAGGRDEKENALEALEAAVNQVDYRPAANKVFVLITDAPFHQKGEDGEGTTDQTTESIIKLLNDNDCRLFSIVPERHPQYREFSERTRGNYFNIDYDFSLILESFSNQLTNLYVLKYKSVKEVIPDSINIAILDDKRSELIRKTIPIVELGRKLIIENLLFEFGKSELPGEVDELQILTQFMQTKPNVSILIEGHTDDVGSEATNLRLSKQRAESVKRYLIRKGINENRIQTKGYGESRPIATNKTEAGRRYNRRTEIVIISK